MPRIIFTAFDGTESSVDAKIGETIMEAAVRNLVPGIDADCGGACACATCHVYIAPEDRAKLGTKSEMESSMLDFADNVTECSRLSCQLRISEEMDGLVVKTPENQ